jgi:transposase
MTMTRAEIQAVYDAGPEAVIALVEQLLGLIAEQQVAIRHLSTRVKQLEDQLATRSQNSSKPPSSDGFAHKTHSRRQKSGRKPGGQPGHAGQTLRMVASPDHTLVHAPTQCQQCGASLADVPTTVAERRQVFDLPPQQIEVTEHQVAACVCPACGQENRGSFPAGVTQPVQYGPHLLSFVVYLLVYQLVPYERVRELVQDLWGATLSVGTVFRAVWRCFAALATTEAQIQAGLRRAGCVRFDETGVRIGGKRYWWHVASTPALTHYGVHRHRGREGIDASGILPEFGGRAVHDAWSPYFSYACAHALCNAHHLRELTFVVEREGQAWAAELIALLLGAHAQVRAARDAGESALPAATMAQIEAQYRELIAAGLAANPKVSVPAGEAGRQRGRPAQSKARNLVERLQRYERETLAFVYDFAVPFDNNLAERDLRMLKVQQKVSGGFRSEAGAVAFGRIRGYLSTLRKQAQPLLAAVASVFHGHPIVPSLPA